MVVVVGKKVIIFHIVRTAPVRTKMDNENFLLRVAKVLAQWFD